MSPYNRLGSLTYAEPPLHAISTTISVRLAPFVRLVPQRPPSLPVRSRCTVAFGLCIIITITASSSWLVVEKPPRILPPSPLPHPPPPPPVSPSMQLPLSSLLRPFSISFSLLSVRKREMRKRRRRMAYVRVCGLIKFLEGDTREIIVGISAGHFLLAINCMLRQTVSQSASSLHVIRCGDG